MAGVSAELMAQLESMGFPATRCKKALHATGNTNADAATQWLFDHIDDPDIDLEEDGENRMDSDSPVDGPRDAKRSATLSAALDGYLGSVRVPSRSDKVYKDECIFCFDNAESSEGLFVCLHAWRAMCRKHAELNSARTGHQLYMRIHTTKTLKEEEPPTDTPSTTVVVPTVIGPRYDYNTTTTIVTIPQGTELCSGDDPDMHTLVRRTVQAILESDSAARVEESMAWQEMRQECEHARNLQQIDNNVTIPSSGHHKCIKCDKDDNLWLNLQDGTILCGRMNFDGTGGNGHALEYYTETNKPLAVKMGTISADGGDVFCYVCDDMVLNPHLGLQLQHFGINMVNMEKTEKTMAELELEQNMKHEWSMVTESGHDLVPLYGPGYTGMRNLGNSCYLASTMQLLFSIPEYASTFTPTKEAVFDYGSHVSDPVNDLNVQLNKLSYGLLSGAYSKPLPPTSEGDTPPEDTNGIRPSSFKTVVGRGHPEFSNSRQQDALEFFQYLLTISEKQTRATGSKNTDKDVPLEHLFRYQVEERLQCGATGKVRYSTTTDNILSLTLPLDQATNKEAVNIYLAKIQEGIAANTPYTEETLPSVRPSIPVEACLSAYLAPNEMANWISPATQTATTAIVSQRMLTFPPYLMVHTRRFYVGDDWTPQKLDVEVEMPEFLDLSTLRGCGGMQDGESSLPESKGTEPPAVVLDESVMSELASAGFGVNACKRAAFNTMGQGAVAAMEWVCGHLDDADLNDPFTLPGATAAVSAEKEASDEHIAQLTSMGFTAAQAKKALQSTDHHVERAVDWLFSHSDELQAMDTAASPSEVPSTTNTGPVPVDFPTGAPQYELQGFASHIGSSTLCGHYVCHVKKGGQYVLFNDEKVAVSKEPPRLFGYLYLYRRVDL